MSVAPRRPRQSPRKRPQHRGPYTVKDYLALDDDKRYELLDGELVVTPSPFRPHQDIVGRLFRVVADHVDAKNLGYVAVAPLDVVLGSRTVCQPDILYVAPKRQSILKKRIEGAPDLVVEVLSETHQGRDRVVKRRIYDKAGIGHLWLIDPEGKTIEELVRDPATGKLQTRELLELADAAFAPAIFPDLTIDLAKLFR